MSHEIALEELWESVPPPQDVFEPERIALLPEAARRYLTNAIAPGTPLASAVRLRMHGEIKLKGWYPFTAEQVIRGDRGMIWKATVRMNGLPISGFDRLVDGEGAMQWKLFGLLPVVTASGADITRSAAGRVEVETIWLPSLLCGPEAVWTEGDASHPHARITAHGETAELTLAIDATGRPLTANLMRWGNPEGANFHYDNFGGILEEERTFGGYTIPTRVRVGWHFGSERFECEGEFFRATIDEAIFR